jgi:hypothetical protein
MRPQSTPAFDKPAEDVRPVSGRAIRSRNGDIEPEVLREGDAPQLADTAQHRPFNTAALAMRLP